MKARPSKRKSVKKLCVVLMPLDLRFKNQWHLAIKPAIESVGLEPLRPDEKRTANNMVTAAVQAIYEATLVIADVTGSNPNVMYEVGLALTIGKRVILVTQAPDNIPRDLQGRRYLQYDANDLPKFTEDLKKTILDTLKMGALQKAERIFPEFEVVDFETRRELSYLRRRCKRITVNVYPPTADIFFNDRLLGPAPQTIHLNPEVPMNTISASNVLYFEEHRPITEKEVESGKIAIVLESLPPDEPRLKKKLDELEARKVPNYIIWKGKTPDSPVIMRAISHFLLHIKAYESYCQMLWIRFFSAQQRRRFAGCLDLFISPASEARFEPVVHLASAGG